MYTYLNQRYGLKNLIIEWAASIINGIKKYSKEDHTVGLFGKILRNECDEEFRFIQIHVTDTLTQLLKVVLKEKHVHKSEADINRQVGSIQTGFVDDQVWAKIIERMYDQQDCLILEEMFHETVRRRIEGGFADVSGSIRLEGKSKMSREEKLVLLASKDSKKLLFNEFLKTVLDFQLSEHEKFLFKFRQIFKIIDNDNNGVINEQEFTRLVQEMQVCDTDGEISYFLQIIDPYNNQQITFSEIVHLLSAVSLSLNVSTWYQLKKETRRQCQCWRSSLRWVTGLIWTFNKCYLSLPEAKSATIYCSKWNRV